MPEKEESVVLEVQNIQHNLKTTFEEQENTEWENL